MLSLSLPLSHPLQNHPCSLKDSTFPPCTHSIWTPRISLQSTNKKSHYISCSSRKIVPDTFLDRHVRRNNRIRFVLKLKTLLLSKPKHYIPLHILSKCRSYLALPDRRSVTSMIRRYPSIFELFSIPTPRLPMNATKSYSQLCVRLTPTAAKLSAQESQLQTAISNNLATKLEKLLMMSCHHRILLSKLVHLAPDLGLPPSFRSRLCNDHLERFRTIDTSYGRALELVSWNEQLAIPLPRPPEVSHNLIVDRPLKFKHLRFSEGGLI
ncbi:Ubiquitin carboxyl-terminal hydrolase family protein [Euphorbia peplus]|nr:Ubiquitin carboxyl-terminal hydrolase family protein [Euphorbia peplus]